MPVLNVTSFWLFAIATSIFSALNERELRQRRADLQALVDVGARLDDVADAIRQAELVLEALVGRFGFERGVAARRVGPAGRRPRDARHGRGADDLERPRLDRQPRLGASRDPAGQAPRPDARPAPRDAHARRAERPRRADDRGRPDDRRHRRRAPRPAAARRRATGRGDAGPVRRDRRPEPAQCRAAPARPGPRRARLADRRGQPPHVPAGLERVLGQQAGRPSRGQGHRGPVPRPRRLQGRQRHARPRRGRRAPGRRDRADRGARPRRRPRRPARRRRVRGPDRGRAVAQPRPRRWPRAWSTSSGRRTSSATSTSWCPRRVGIASARDAIAGAADLVRNADVAMYMAKANGKSGFAVFDPGMHEAMRERHELSVDLQRAVDLDQLALMFQPIVDLRDRRAGRRRGARALAPPDARPDHARTASSRSPRRPARSCRSAAGSSARPASRPPTGWPTGHVAARDVRQRQRLGPRDPAARVRRRRQGRARRDRARADSGSSSRSPRPRSCEATPGDGRHPRGGPRDRRPHRHRRLRDRLLLAQPPAPVPGRRPQDRRASSSRTSTRRRSRPRWPARSSR